jgi:hypothetical protein
MAKRINVEALKAYNDKLIQKFEEHENDEAEEDKTAMSYWLPKLEAAGLPTPKTARLPIPKLAVKAVWARFDGKRGSDEEEKALSEFARRIAKLGETVCGGYPFFLRTDQTSGKHEWKRTCFIDKGSDIIDHILSIANYSELAGFLGIPWGVWFVREFLPTKPYGVFLGYNDMPICKEFRFFVDDGVVRCVHPYWPVEALEQGKAPKDLDYEGLCRFPENEGLRELACAAGRAVGGSWSIDLLETERGWYVTDMAEAYKSYHWPDCPLRDNAA